MAGHAKEKQMNTATGLNTDQARPSLGSLADALVMMVDDESVLIEITQAFLEDAGYRRFISTTDSTEAIALLLRERPHVLLLDLNMPKMSGFDILAQMQADKVLKHIPVIVMTSEDAAQTKLKALELGAMEKARGERNFTELAALAHWLKGAAGTVGYDAFTESAIELEQLAKARAESQIEAAIRRLRQLERKIVAPVGPTIAAEGRVMTS